MGYFSMLGLGGTLLPGALWARIADGAEISEQTIACAAELADLTFTEDERKMMVEDLKSQARQIGELHGIALANAVPSALWFNPVLPGMRITPSGDERERTVRSRPTRRDRPSSDEELAFLPVTELSELVRRRRVTSEQLVELYISRIKRLDAKLLSVVTLTEERARRQARAMDAEIRRGRYRGPLHGIPWGAKDLLAVKGYPTTWGTPPFRDQIIDEDATVVQRLDAAGAVLIAKLTLGELAYGDVWFGGMTRNPWKLDQGSSGSSAGPAAAVVAGLAGFTIGSETLGSISSPSTRCGASGLRPTFGRVPRTGAMALCWSMDKLGPICRSAEDCALVLESIVGPDGHDLAVHDQPYRWNANVRARDVRVGFFKAAFERDAANYPTKAFDNAVLDVLRGEGVQLVTLESPQLPLSALRLILSAEAAAAFDELTRSGKDDTMVRQTREAWPNTFRVARFIPAIDYINANRARTLAMQAYARLFEHVDVIVTPTFHAQLTATNFTGHPAVIVPNGYRPDGTPVSITFLGRLFGESKALAVAAAYQSKTDFHLRRPEI